jgi:hypothetical protein
MNNIEDKLKNNIKWNYPVVFNNKNDNIVYLIYSEIKYIIDNNINNILNFNLKKIYTLSSSDIVLLFEELSNIVTIKNIYTYKNNYYKPLVIFIINIILKCYETNNIIDLSYNKYNLLITLSSINDAQIELKKIKHILINYNYIDFNILINVSQNGTFPIFLFWWNFFNVKLSKSNYSELLKLSIINNDDRVFKFLLNLIIDNINKLDIIDYQYDNTDINYMSIIVLLMSSNINKKYKLKKLKLLSLKKDLSEFYKIMITNEKNIKTINILSKYYYKTPLDYDTLFVISYINNIEIMDSKTFYNNLKTIEEKNIYQLLFFFNHGLLINSNFLIKSNNINISSDILNKEYYYILSKINLFINLIVHNKINYIDNILKYYSSNNYINKYIEENNNLFYYNKLIFYTKFLVFNNTAVTTYILYNINKLLHLLRCLMKRKKNNIINNFNYNFRVIINDIKNIKPNILLKEGSYNYQLLKQKFNNRPPKYLLPCENIIDKLFLIKENFDEMLVQNLPLDIYPYNENLYKYEIKATYIDKFNLYLIYDINIPNYSIIDRQLFLKNIFNFNFLNKIIKVNNFDELFNYILEEKTNLFNFIKLNKNKNKVLWYPKPVWEILINKNNYNNLISNINIDGLILTPLDGSCELQIKPKNIYN